VGIISSNKEGSAFTLNKVKKSYFAKSIYVRKRNRSNLRRELERILCI
jgi:hypothetical protein